MVADLEERHGALPADFADRHRMRLWPLFERELQAIPGVTAILDSLTCKSCVASSGRPERLKHALSLVGLYDRFQPNIFSATEVRRGKPAPDLFLYAAESMQVDPHRTLVIEDSISGVTAGKAAGMTVWGFVGGSHYQSRDGNAILRKAGADRVFERMADFWRTDR
jgi:HAD superfamily hydrolase (TIGR01509 family)